VNLGRIGHLYRLQLVSRQIHLDHRQVAVREAQLSLMDVLDDLKLTSSSRLKATGCSYSRAGTSFGKARAKRMRV
jgi:hypothetical protein